MKGYTTLGEMQNELKEYYERTHMRLQFTELYDYLCRKGRLHQKPPANVHMPDTVEWMSDKEFNQSIDRCAICLTSDAVPVPIVNETRIIPNRRDVFIIRHPRYTRPQLHCHDFFEINFVSDGFCHFIFQQVSAGTKPADTVKSHKLVQGDVCIIAPSSPHDIVISDESTVFCILLRRSTFDTTFFSLLARQDPLACFFRTILIDKAYANYLLFSTSHNDALKMPLRNALKESFCEDPYSNACTVHWINLFFSALLRYYNKTVPAPNSRGNADFSLILQYIQQHYRTLTLASLAAFFHYSEAYMCAQIRKYTGTSLLKLIRQLRLADAKSFLENTTLKISDIAAAVGYPNTDHFSKVFRSECGMSPQKYRKMRTSCNRLA